ncbi:hypothetical protein GCM10029964_050600 [Kibdelosporangium lantanae]
MRHVVVLAAVTAVTLIGSTAQACADGPLRGWRQVDHVTVSATTGNEGVTTVRPPHGKAYLAFRGAGAIPQQLKDEGWGHVGDPDSTRGYVVDAYQNTRDVPAPNKMFLVTTPTGQTYEYVHKLQPEEPPANANAQVTITPDAHWLVAGPLGQVTRLFVYPLALDGHGGDLPLVAHVNLDHPIRNAQGCDFLTETRLLCGTSDPNNDLYPTSFQLLQIDLARPIRGRDVQAHVTSLGQVPLVSTCTTTDFVTEGVDWDAPSGQLRIEVNRPTGCNSETDVYTFHRG